MPSLLFIENPLQSPNPLSCASPLSPVAALEHNVPVISPHTIHPYLFAIPLLSLALYTLLRHM